MSGSASLIKARSRPSIVPRQSPSSLIRASISREGDPLCCGPLFFMPVSPSLVAAPIRPLAPPPPSAVLMQFDHIAVGIAREDALRAGAEADRAAAERN